MALPFIMAGVSALSQGSQILGNRSARKRQQKAIKTNIRNLEAGFEFDLSTMLEGIEQIGKVAGADTRSRMLQARREAGRISSLGQSAGITQDVSAIGETAYGRATGDLETITTNTERTRRASFRDISARRLTLNSQISSLKAGAPQAPNAFLSALQIGSSAVGSYMKYGGTFGGDGDDFVDYYNPRTATSATSPSAPQYVQDMFG